MGTSRARQTKPSGENDLGLKDDVRVARVELALVRAVCRCLLDDSEFLNTPNLETDLLAHALEDGGRMWFEEDTRGLRAQSSQVFIHGKKKRGRGKLARANLVAGIKDGRHAGRGLEL